MTQQSEALRHADKLDAHEFDEPHGASAELRRQHALLQEWKAKAATWLASPEAAQRLDGYRELSQRANRAEAQRDALLAALKRAEPLLIGPILLQARAAIKAAEEGK